MTDTEDRGIHPLEALWRASTAKEFYQRLQVAIEDTKASLKEGQSVVLASVLPSGESLYVEKVGFFNPNLLSLYCRAEDGNECTLLMHPSNVTLVLRVLTLRPDEPKRPLGFVGGKE